MFKVLPLLVLVSLGFSQDDKSKENESIKKLNLSNKGLTSLNEYDFTKYPNLEELDLSNNLIENIKEDKFTKNKKLKKINLSGNTQLKLPEFSTLLIADIEEINLSNCNIDVFPPSILDGLIQLKVIDLSENPLASVKLITFTNLLSPEKIILPNLDDKKTITDICNELNITIEDTVKSLQCEDVRNDKWEGTEKKNSRHLDDAPNVDTPVNLPQPEEITSSQSEISNTDTNKDNTNTDSNDKQGGDTNVQQNVADVIDGPQGVSKSSETKNNTNETETSGTAEPSDEPNSITNDKAITKTVQVENSSAQNPEPDLINAKPDNVNTVDTNKDTTSTDLNDKQEVSKSSETQNTKNETEVSGASEVNGEPNSVISDKVIPKAAQNENSDAQNSELDLINAKPDTINTVDTNIDNTNTDSNDKQGGDTNIQQKVMGVIDGPQEVSKSSETKNTKNETDINGKAEANNEPNSVTNDKGVPKAAQNENSDAQNTEPDLINAKPDTINSVDTNKDNTNTDSNNKQKGDTNIQQKVTDVIDGPQEVSKSPETKNETDISGTVEANNEPNSVTNDKAIPKAVQNENSDAQNPEPYLINGKPDTINTVDTNKDNTNTDSNDKQVGDTIQQKGIDVIDGPQEVGKTSETKNETDISGTVEANNEPNSVTNDKAIPKAVQNENSDAQNPEPDLINAKPDTINIVDTNKDNTNTDSNDKQEGDTIQQKGTDVIDGPQEVNKSPETKDTEKETEISDIPEANDEPNSVTNDKRIPKAVQVEDSDTQNTEPYLTNANQENIDTVDAPQAANEATAEKSNTSTVNETSKTPDTVSLTDSKKNEINDTKATEIDKAQKPDPKESQPVINQDIPKKTDNELDSLVPQVPGVNVKPVINQETSEKQNSKTAAQEAKVPPENIKPSSVTSNDNKEVVPQIVQTPESPKDQEKQKSDVPIIDLQRFVPIPPAESPEKQKPDVPAANVQRSIPTAPQAPPQIENTQSSANKESKQPPSTGDQVNQNSKTLDTKQSQQIKQEDTAEVPTGASTSSSTGTNILIFLVVAVVISGIAAFGYRFYKTRNYSATSTQEPIERELQEIVTDKRSNGPPLSNVIEEEPLMQKHENSVEIKEVDEITENSNYDVNHTSSNSKPYVPTESIPTIDDVKDTEK